MKNLASLNLSLTDASLLPQGAAYYTVPNPDKIIRVAKTTFDYEQSSSRSDFLAPEWDFAEIARYAMGESYVARSIAIKSNLMLKQHWDLVGYNPKTLSYIKSRFKQIGITTGEPIELLIHRTVVDLIQYHNAFWVKVRRPEGSVKGTRSRKIANRTIPLDPVVAYFYLPTETVHFRKTAKKVTGYAQVINGETVKEWKAEDVVHFTYDKRGGFMAGTPQLVSVIEDIVVLRALEEDIAKLVHKNLFPVYHYKVGTDAAPAKIDLATGKDEVEKVRDAVELIPRAGALITDHRHDISVIGAENKALRSETYLAHFKLRVLGGLGITPLDVGETDSANKSTSETVSRALIDSVKGYQRMFEWLMNKYVIEELLLESTLAETVMVLDEPNIVYFKFPEIDIESKIKMETHATQLWLNNAITLEEYRQMVSKDPMSEEEWGRTYFNLITRPLEEMKIEMKGEIDKEKARMKGIDNKVRPANQYKKLSGPKKFKDSEEINVFWDQDNFNESKYLDYLKEIAEEFQVFDSYSPIGIIELAKRYSVEVKQRLDSIKEMPLLTQQTILDGYTESFKANIILNEVNK